MTKPTLYSAFGTVKQYEQEGVTLDLGVAKFRIRRAGGVNRRYSVVLAQKLRPHRRALDAGVLAEDVSASILMETYFETVVIGWEGVTDEEGNSLPYTLENFKKVMTDLPDLWSILMREADTMKNFQAEEVAEDGEKLGNS